MYFPASLASLIGVFGQAGYCAANAFQDTFAYYTRNKYKFDYITINWDTWKEVGMAAAGQERYAASVKNQQTTEGRETVKTYLEHSITPAEGVRIFYKALSINLPQIIVSTLDLNNPAIIKMYKTLHTFLSGSADNSPKTIEKFSKEQIDRQLSDIWMRSFAVEQIGTESNFFKLGGDSLLALNMVSDINKRFQIKLSLNAFLEIPTFGEISRIIDTLLNPAPDNLIAPSKKIDQLVLLKKGDTARPPIFLIHPVGGTVYLYKSLCNFLPDTQTVFGIEAVGVDGTQPLLTTIEAMAALYIDIMRTVQPVGPYVIGGSSLGGCVAYAMALQLGQENVAKIFLIDTPGPKTKIPYLSTDADVLAYFLSYNNADQEQVTTHLKQLPENERYAYFLNQNGTYQQLLSGHNSIETMKNSVSMTLVNSKAMEQYFSNLTQAYAGDAVFFAATEPSQIPVQLEKDWAGFLTGQVTVHRIPGNHISINKEPVVELIAKAMGE